MADDFEPDDFEPDAPDPRAESNSTWSQKLGEGMLPGFNRASSAFSALLDPLVPGRTKDWGEDFGTRYQQHLRAAQAQSQLTQQEHPWASAGVQTGGALLSGRALPSTGSGLINGLRQGAAYGAMYGAGEAPADAGLKTIGTHMAGGAAGGAVAAAIPSAMLAGENAVRMAVSHLAPKAPTAAAQKLLSLGVPLTTGQMAGPGSALGQFEAVSANNPLGLGAARHEAEIAAMRVMQNQGVAPGAKTPSTPDLQGRLAELFKGFGPAYDKIRGQPIDPKTLANLTDAAAMPRRGVDAKTAAGVKAEVENALTVLGKQAVPSEPKPSGLLDASGRPIPAPPAEAPAPIKTTAGDLLKVRENIRENIRAARQSQDFDRLRLLEGAEDVVSRSVEANLSPELRQLLRTTDRQYARLMTAANAAPSGQTEFTPLQYLKQVEKSAGKRLFKQGRAGDLQDLGEAARETFVNAPMTGYRGAVLGSIPFGSKLVAPLAAWANSPGGRGVFMAPGGPTLPMSAAGSAPVARHGVNTVSPALQRFLEALARGGPRVGMPVPADEETPTR